MLARPLRTAPEAKRKQQVHLTPPEVSQLVAEYEAGSDMKELAARWGVYRHTVAGHLRRAGIPLRRQGLSEVQLPEVMRLYLSGWSLARLGEQFDCDPETVRRALKREGVALRKAWER